MAKVKKPIPKKPPKKPAPNPLIAQTNSVIAAQQAPYASDNTAATKQYGAQNTAYHGINATENTALNDIGSNYAKTQQALVDRAGAAAGNQQADLAKSMDFLSRMFGTSASDFGKVVAPAFNVSQAANVGQNAADLTGAQSAGAASNRDLAAMQGAEAMRTGERSYNAGLARDERTRQNTATMNAIGATRPQVLAKIQQQALQDQVLRDQNKRANIQQGYDKTAQDAQISQAATNAQLSAYANGVDPNNPQVIDPNAGADAAAAAKQQSAWKATIAALHTTMVNPATGLVDSKKVSQPFRAVVKQLMGTDPTMPADLAIQTAFQWTFGNGRSFNAQPGDWRAPSEALKMLRNLGASDELSKSIINHAYAKLGGYKAAVNPKQPKVKGKNFNDTVKAGTGPFGSAAPGGTKSTSEGQSSNYGGLTNPMFA